MRLNNIGENMNNWTAEDYLMHHGIKGMKWGVRRYQNKDGSLTAVGRMRYGSKGASDAPGDENTHDHTKSDKSPLVMWAVRTGTHALMMNPILLAEDTGYLSAAIIATVREKCNEKRMSELEVDDKTGFHKKAEEFTEKQDMAKVNPGYFNFDGNTKNNCMLCTLTYEMRRRGYDVAANKASYGYSEKDNERWFKGAKVISAKEHSKITVDRNDPQWKEQKHKHERELTNAKFGLNKELADQTMAALSKEPVGSRGNLMVTWGAGGGHSMVYEVTGSGVVVRDCQTNRIYTKPEKILKQCVSSSYCRLDNLDFNPEKIKEVCH